MRRGFVLPILAALGIFSALKVASAGSAEPPPAAPVAEPASSPFDVSVSGSGIVEASSENIGVGTQIAGTVARVFVVAGGTVRAGDPLFQIELREANAEMEVKQATLDLAEAEIKTARAARDEAFAQFRRAEDMHDVKVLSAEERDRRRFAFQTAESKLGVAEAQAKARRAELELARTNLERRTVTAPIDGTVLQVNVRPGEYAPAADVQDPPILMGETDPLNIRVDIDENDAWRVKEGAKAIATLRGNKEIGSKLEFVRFEPYVVPKRSLTGSSTERTDTRVLQVIFRVEQKGLRIFVGQLVDVFVDGSAL